MVTGSYIETFCPPMYLFTVKIIQCNTVIFTVAFPPSSETKISSSAEVILKVDTLIEVAHALLAPCVATPDTYVW